MRRAESRLRRASNERKAIKSSSSDLLIVRPPRRRWASWKVVSSTSGAKALGVRIHSDSGMRTEGVPSF
jgi:hypothetical protein